MAKAKTSKKAVAKPSGYTVTFSAKEIQVTAENSERGEVHVREDFWSFRRQWNYDLEGVAGCDKPDLDDDDFRLQDPELTDSPGEDDMDEDGRGLFTFTLSVEVDVMATSEKAAEKAALAKLQA